MTRRKSDYLDLTLSADEVGDRLAADEAVQDAEEALSAVEAERDELAAAVAALDARQYERDAERATFEARRGEAADAQDIDAVELAESRLRAIGTVDARVAEIRQAFQHRLDGEFPARVREAEAALHEAEAARDRLHAERGDLVARRQVDVIVRHEIRGLLLDALKTRMPSDELVARVVGLPDSIARLSVDEPAKFADLLDAATAPPPPEPEPSLERKRARFRELAADIAAHERNQAMLAQANRAIGEAAAVRMAADTIGAR